MRNMMLPTLAAVVLAVSPAQAAPEPKPAAVLDAKGYVRFAHYGRSMSDIPTNEELLQVIDELIAASY